MDPAGGKNLFLDERKSLIRLMALAFQILVVRQRLNNSLGDQLCVHQAVHVDEAQGRGVR
ncbi:hypothetical protein D3C71_1402800 [compost metagenome]